jgi:EmrB/QacA subfamily drug resistance transporter
MDPRKRVILILCCLAQFMVVLDIAIVNVALPSIGTDLALKQSTLQWVVIAYGLLLGGFLLLGGRFGDLIGRKKIFLAGIALFSVASLVAGLAQSAQLLIVARGVQGFGAAMLAPSALSILAVTFVEGKERNGALGIFGAVAGSSASVGVIASGLLTDGPGWRWVFFINVPIGLILLLLAARYLPNDDRATGLRHYDAAGAATVTGGLLALVYGLNRGVDSGWTSASTLFVFALAVVLLAAFVVVERGSASPLVPGSILRNRTLVAANCSAFCLMGAFYAFIFLGSLLMQDILRYSPTRTGVAWLATSVLAFVAAGITGAKLVNSLGVKWLIAAGMAALCLSGVLLNRVPADASYPVDLLPALILAGVAIGLAAPSVQIGALSGARTEGIGLASGLIETMREIGGAVGIAAVSTVLVSRLNSANGLVDAGARNQEILGGFQSAFTVIAIIAGIGLLLALFTFPRRLISVELADQPAAEDVQAEQAAAFG